MYFMAAVWALAEKADGLWVGTMVPNPWVVNEDGVQEVKSSPKQQNTAAHLIIFFGRVE